MAGAPHEHPDHGARLRIPRRGDAVAAGLAARRPRRVGRRAGAVPGVGLRVHRSDAAGAVGGDAGVARRRTRRAAGGRAGSRARREGRAARAAPRVQVLRPDVPAGVVPAGARAERRDAGVVRGERPGGGAAGPLPSRPARHGGPAVRGERAAGGDLRDEEPRHRPDVAERGAAVPGGPRPARAAVPVPGAGAGSLRGRPRRGTHEHAARRCGDPLPAVQPGQPAGRGAMRGGQSAASFRAPHRILLGRRAGARQLSRRPGPLPVRRDAGAEGR